LRKKLGEVLWSFASEALTLGAIENGGDVASSMNGTVGICAGSIN
jgi:hypothetical protein